LIHINVMHQRIYVYDSQGRPENYLLVQCSLIDTND
jgi:hypothetical protein